MDDTQDFDINDVDARVGGGCFSQLLFSDQISQGHETSSSSKMLCFGRSSDTSVGRSTALISSGGGVTCSDSSSTSDLVSSSTINVTDQLARRVKGKKSSKIQKAQVKTGHAKQVRNKVKLGERILALQHLVSPFGKTDTASVLHEAMGYIKFLHDQVTVLCSPYFSLPSYSSATVQLQVYEEGGENKDAEKKGNLRSSGLCLVPVESTVHVANNNGADFWSPMAYESTNAPKAKH